MIGYVLDGDLICVRRCDGRDVQRNGERGDEQRAALKRRRKSQPPRGWRPPMRSRRRQLVEAAAKLARTGAIASANLRLFAHKRQKQKMAVGVTAKKTTKPNMQIRVSIASGAQLEQQTI